MVTISDDDCSVPNEEASASPSASFAAPWASAGLRVITDYAWDFDSFGIEIDNELFTLRPYDEKNNADRPNFLYKPTGLAIWWYKHTGRGVASNYTDTAGGPWDTGCPECWFEIVARCLAFMLGFEDTAQGEWQI